MVLSACVEQSAALRSSALDPGDANPGDNCSQRLTTINESQAIRLKRNGASDEAGDERSDMLGYIQFGTAGLVNIHDAANLAEAELALAPVLR